MNEVEKWIKDYKDCNDHLKNIDKNNYLYLSCWALLKIGEWIKKDKKYTPLLINEYMPPRNFREQAIYLLLIFKTTLEKIAFFNAVSH